MNFRVEYSTEDVSKDEKASDEEKKDEEKKDEEKKDEPTPMVSYKDLVRSVFILIYLFENTPA